MFLEKEQFQLRKLIDNDPGIITIFNRHKNVTDSKVYLEDVNFKKEGKQKGKVLL